MTEQYTSASGGAERSILDGAIHSHETAQCLTDVVSSSTSAAHSGRETPLEGEGQETPHDSSNDADEDDESMLLSLGDERTSLKQADVVEQHGEQRASDLSLAYLVPGQRRNTPVVSVGSPDTFSLPSPNMLWGAETLAAAMAILVSTEACGAPER